MLQLYTHTYETSQPFSTQQKASGAGVFRKWSWRYTPIHAATWTQQEATAVATIVHARAKDTYTFVHMYNSAVVSISESGVGKVRQFGVHSMIPTFLFVDVCVCCLPSILDANLPVYI